MPLQVVTAPAAREHLMKSTNIKTTNITTTKIVCTAIYVLFTLSILIAVGNVGQYINFPSFLVVAVIAVLFAASAQGEESIVQKFGN